MYTVKYVACYYESSMRRRLAKYSRTFRCRSLLRAVRAGQRRLAANDCGESVTIYDGEGRVVLRMRSSGYVTRRGDRFAFESNGRAYCTARGGYRPSTAAALASATART